jgi:predicted KAP-like P-loop ATPase
MAAELQNNYNPKGRGKGNVNKITMKTRELFSFILEEEQDNFIEALDKVRKTNPKEYLAIMIKISERFVPPVTKTEITGPDGEEFKPIQIILPKPLTD